MNNILVDPILVITPPDDASKAEIEAWVDTLQVWLHEVFDSPHHWYHPAEVIMKNLGYKRLPNFTALRNWQNKYRMDMDIREIMRHVSGFFLQETFEFKPQLEAQLLELGYIAEPKPDVTMILPQQFVDRWPETVRIDLAMVLAMAGISKAQGSPLACTLAIATLPLAETRREIEVSGEVSLLSEYEEQREQTFAEVFPLLYTPESIAPLDVVSVWRQGEKTIKKAIEQQFTRDWQAAGLQVMPFCLGTRFLTSVGEHGLETNAIVLAKIVRLAAAIIADKAMELNCDLHPLRESRAAGSPQRTRESDGAKAWRLTLTDKGAGWRMHYWRIPAAEGNIIEFANILKKHDPEEIY